MIDGRPALWCVCSAVLVVVLAAGGEAARASSHGPASGAGHPPRVGLVVLTRVNLTRDGADQLAVGLAGALRARLAVEVVAGPAVRQRLAADPPDDCAARSACVHEVASRLGADQLLFLVMVRLGPLVKIESTWVSAGGAGPAGRPVIVIHRDRGGAEPAFAAASDRLLPRARMRGPARAVSGGGAGGGAARVMQVPAPAGSRDSSSARGKRHVTAAVAIAAGAAGLSLAVGAGLGLSARSTYNSLASDRLRSGGVPQRLEPHRPDGAPGAGGRHPVHHLGGRRPDRGDAVPAVGLGDRDAAGGGRHRAGRRSDQHWRALLEQPGHLQIT